MSDKPLFAMYGSDICVCGDFRGDHLNGSGKCNTCGDSRRFADGCVRFEFSHRASAKDQAIWDDKMGIRRKPQSTNPNPVVGEEVELPPLEPITDAHKGERVGRWQQRVFSRIDEAEEFGMNISGESQAHAGMEAEWDLMQRESQLRSALSQLAQAKKEIEELKQYAPRWREQAKGATHYEGCWRDHRDCCIARVLELQRELGR